MKGKSVYITTMMTVVFIVGILVGEKYFNSRYIVKNRTIGVSNTNVSKTPSNSIPYENIFPDNKISDYKANAKLNSSEFSEDFVAKLEKNNEDKPLFPKEIFLTFDDGPSYNNTLKILNILKENDIKATFFIIGNNAEAHADVLKTIKESGMCIATHTFSHDYAIYKSKETYFEDLYKCNETIKKILGTYPIPYIRLPGGSDNTIGSKSVMQTIRLGLKEKNIRYVDWNVSSGDSASITVPMETIKNNLLTQLSQNSFAVMLMHDSPAKTTSSEALPYVIKYLKNNGFVFRTFNDLTPSEEKKMINLKIINR